MGSARTRARTSSLGGVPTTLAEPAVAEPRQLALGLAAPGAPTTPVRTEVLPDVVLIRDWLPFETQRELAAQFRSWAAPPAGLRHPRVPTGHLMTVQSVCLGWHWQPYAYSRTADDTDGAPVKPLPPRARRARRRAVVASYGDDHGFSTRVRARRRDREPLRAPERTWVCIKTVRSRRRAGGHHQPRRRLRLPHGGRRPPHRRRSPTSSCTRATCSCSPA